MLHLKTSMKMLRADVLQSSTRRLLQVTSLDMTTSEAKLIRILATETFQLNGFDENQYRLVLVSVGYNPVRTKKNSRRDKTISQLARTIEASVIVTELKPNELACR